MTQLWTRHGKLPLEWGPYDRFEELAFTPALRESLTKMAVGLMSSAEAFEKLKLPHRHGCLFFGAPGTGKSAATRALALCMGWNYLCIPSHEILDAHFLARALSDASQLTQAVICLENIDDVLTRVDPRTFFAIFDEFSSRSKGIFWAATTRYPEEMPKNLLVRPGRFDDALRLNVPSAEVRAQYIKTYLAPLLPAQELPAATDDVTVLAEASEGLSFAHLHELRQLLASRVLRGQTENLMADAKAFCRDQTISGERWGGETDENAELRERIRMADPRTLISALQITDVIKRVIETTLSQESENPGQSRGEVKA